MGQENCFGVLTDKSEITSKGAANAAPFLGLKYNLSAKPKVEAPADLTVTDTFDLTWKASPDAVSYKIYRAVNDQATYALVAQNVTATAYSYKPTVLQTGDQVILRVTAVNKDGVESEGIRAVTHYVSQ